MTEGDREIESERKQWVITGKGMAEKKIPNMDNKQDLLF